MDKIKEFIMKNKISCISLSSVLVLCIITGTIIGVNSKKEPKKQEKKNESSMSSTVSDNKNSEYTTSVNENGETVVVDKNGNIVSDVSVSENGDIVVKDKTGKETVAVKAKDVKKYTDKETESNNSSVTNESHTESSSVPSASNSSSTANKPSGSGSGSNKPSAGQGSGGSQTTTPSTGGATPSQPSQTKYNEPSEAQLAAVEAEFLRLVNAERARVGVQPLTRNNILDKAAKIRAEELSKNMSHTRPNGSKWDTILQEVQYGTKEENIVSDDGINWRTEIFYYSGAGGENLLGDYGNNWLPEFYTSSIGIAQKCFNGFRYSSGHYANMINGSYSKTGIKLVYFKENTPQGEVDGIRILQIFSEL